MRPRRAAVSVSERAPRSRLRRPAVPSGATKPRPATRSLINAHAERLLQRRQHRQPELLADRDDLVEDGLAAPAHELDRALVAVLREDRQDIHCARLTETEVEEDEIGRSASRSPIQALRASRSRWSRKPSFRNVKDSALQMPASSSMTKQFRCAGADVRAAAATIRLLARFGHDGLHYSLRAGSLHAARAFTASGCRENR